jgi:hypothetical protein
MKAELVGQYAVVGDYLVGSDGRPGCLIQPSFEGFSGRKYLAKEIWSMNHLSQSGKDLELDLNQSSI